MEGVAESRIFIPARTRSRRVQAAIEQGIKAFFGGNALVAVIVLALITIFLFREGAGFFGQNLANLRLYRQAGLEYVDIIRGVSEQHEALSRKLSEIRLREFRAMEARKIPLAEINASLASYDQFASAFSDTADDLHGLVSDLTEKASSLKEQLAAAGASHAATLREAGLPALREGETKFEAISGEITPRLYTLLAAR
jgi:phosphate transport system permease protein